MDVAMGWKRGELRAQPTYTHGRVYTRRPGQICSTPQGAPLRSAMTWGVGWGWGEAQEGGARGIHAPDHVVGQQKPAQLQSSYTPRKQISRVNTSEKPRYSMALSLLLAPVSSFHKRLKKKNNVKLLCYFKIAFRLLLKAETNLKRKHSNLEKADKSQC